MLKKRNFFWWGILLLLLAMAGWGYYEYQKPHRSAGDEPASVSVTADTLVAQYERDEHMADAQYLGKVINVRGKVVEIQRMDSSETWILSGSSGGGGISCHLFTPSPVHEKLPPPGTVVNVKGRCTGFLLDVNLADCVLQEFK